ncbi:Glutaredoxin [Balamuthia mandrillaris]
MKKEWVLPLLVLGWLFISFTVVVFAKRPILRAEEQEPHYKEGEHNPAYQHDNQDEDAEDNRSALEVVQDKINSHDVMFFSKSYCPFCRKAKSLLNSENIQYEVLELDLHPRGTEFQNALLELTGQKTVPNIFIKGKHLGGSDKLYEAHSRGELRAMLD